MESEENSAGESIPPVHVTPTFQDASDPPRVWGIKLTGTVIEDVLKNTGVDLIPEDQDYQHVVNLNRSFRKLGAVLWHCVRRQAEQQNVDQDAFFENFDGVVYAAGMGALVDAIHFFIQKMNPSQAETFTAIYEAAMKVLRAESDARLEVIRSQSTDKAIKDATEVIRGKMQRGLVKEFGRYAANLPESLELTQPIIRSEN